jgi:hypothetical protein
MAVAFAAQGRVQQLVEADALCQRLEVILYFSGKGVI